MKIFLPFNLVNVQWSLTTQMREVAVRCREVEFFSFSKPRTDEDRREAGRLWSHPHLHAVGKRHLLTQRYDVVHQLAATWHTAFAVAATKLRSAGRVKHAYTICTGITEDDAYYRWILQALHSAEHMTAVSRSAAERAEKLSGRKVDAVIPNGIDTLMYAPAAPDAVRPAHVPDEPYVLFVGTIDANKQALFVADLAERMPDLRFVLAGNPGPPEITGELRRRQMRRPNLDWRGYISRELLRDLYQYCTCFVLPSRSEGLPMSVIEAMGCGVPVIAQPVSSLPEVITHDVDGWMYPVGEIGEWVQRLEKVFAWTSEERSRFAAVTRKSAIERFAWERVAPQYEQFYRSIC